MDEDQLLLRPAKPPPAGISEDEYRHAEDLVEQVTMTEPEARAEAHSRNKHNFAKRCIGWWEARLAKAPGKGWTIIWVDPS